MKILDWDTEFWGVRIGLASGPDADAWAIENRIAMMWLLVSADDPAQAQEAEERGWRFMDVRVELECAVNKVISPRAFDIREWNADDLPALTALARRAHRITRFYADPQLDNERCDDLYAQWILNSCNGWAQHVFVCEGGYATVHADGDTGWMGLMAVPEENRGRGIGAALVERVSEWAYQLGLQRMTAATQGRNVQSIRLYLRNGYKYRRSGLWFHKRWPNAA